ncbi:hypothetical protein ACWIUD_05290 [Helicobacter sp. 23-1044]
MRLFAVILLMCQICLAAGINFDFEDARKKGYTDKEILDYVAQNHNAYDIAALRSMKLSDKEIVDYFITKDAVTSQIIELKRNAFKDSDTRNKVYPQELSADLAEGCRIYTGKTRAKKDGWSYIVKLTDFARATYTSAYLSEADYFDIDSAQSVHLKDICGVWLNKLGTKEEISRLYALSLVKEINILVKQKKSLVLE